MLYMDWKCNWQVVIIANFPHQYISSQVSQLIVKVWFCTSLTKMLNPSVFLPWWTCRSDTPFVDLKEAAESGCSAYFPLNRSLPSGTVVSIELGFIDKRNCTQEAIDFGTALVDTAVCRCSHAISDVLSSLQFLVGPLPNADLPASFLPTEQDEESITREESQDVGEGSKNVSGPSMVESYDFAMLLKNRTLEAAFAAQRNTHLGKVDIFVLVVCFCAFVLLSVLQLDRYDVNVSPYLKTRLDLFYSFPALLLLNSYMRGFCKAHWELLLAYLLATLALWLRHNRLHTDSADSPPYYIE